MTATRPLTLLRTYVQFCGCPRRLLGVAVAAALAQTFLAVAIPLLLRWTFADVLPRREVLPLLAAGGAILLLFAAKAGVAFAARLSLLAILKKATTRLREALLDKLYAVSRAYYHAADRGHLHNTLVRDTERADVLMYAVTAECLTALVTAGLLVGVLVYISWMLFVLVLVLIVPAAALLRLTLVPALRRRLARLHRGFERYSREIYRALELMDLTRARAAEEAETARQRRHMKEFQESCESLVFADALYRALNQTLMAAGGTLLLILGGAFLTESRLAVGDLVAFYVTLILLRGAVEALLARYTAILEGFAALGHIRELLAVADLGPYRGRRQHVPRSRLALHAVHFGYNGEPLLRDIDLTIDVGQTIALTGVNGSGKTTLLLLLLGLYQPRSGTLLADAVPYDELDLAHLRRAVGVVLQEPMLFHGTVRENLCYGLPEVTEQQMAEAARLATADEVIDRLPDHFDSVIGEGGVLLSGGQRQRLAIARALLGRPRFLILDEPTTHLDQEAVGRLLENLARLPERPAVVLITHEARVVRLAERVYRLEGGRLAPVEEEPCTRPAGLHGNGRLPPTG